MLKPIHALYDKLKSLRLLACVIYDKSTFGKLPQDEVMAALKPVHDEYAELSHHAITHDIDETCFAIVQFEKDAKAMSDHAEMIMEKANDLISASQRLKDALTQDMHAHGHEVRNGRVHSAAVVDKIENGVKTKALVVR